MFLLIAVRQVFRFNIRIWQIMLGGAVTVLISGQISPSDALDAINIDVMLFLLGMFIVGEAMVESGYLSLLSSRIFSHARTGEQVVFLILFGIGLFSAVLMNDTLAIICTPLVLSLATKFRLSPKLMLLSLAIAVTTGSVMSPIGNPQNLLIAMNSGMDTPFVTFGLYLFIPTLLSLGCAFLFLKMSFRTEFSDEVFEQETVQVKKNKAILPVQCSLAIILILAAINITASFSEGKILVPLPLIAICAAVPVMLFCRSPVKLFKNIDWPTLLFFAAMFVLMESVWQTGFFQAFVDGSMVTSVPMILLTSVVVSQFISNVPFVALFQPMILEAGGTTAELMALAAGSTIAGNLTILGAASNVIIIQNAEKQGQTLTFLDFAKIGIPLTMMQIGIYWAWLSVLSF